MSNITQKKKFVKILVSTFTDTLLYTNFLDTLCVIMFFMEQKRGRKCLPHYLRGKRTVVYIPMDMHKEILERARKEGKSFSLVVYELLSKALESPSS